MKYDDGSWHVGSAPSEAHAIAHIALYFKWCLLQGLLSEEHTGDQELEGQLAAIRAGKRTASDYLWENTSGKFADVDLTEEGNRFTKWYMSKRYISDLLSVVGKDAYEFTEAEVDYDALAKVLDQKFKDWRESPPRKPWWKFW